MAKAINRMRKGHRGKLAILWPCLALCSTLLFNSIGKSQNTVLWSIEHRDCPHRSYLLGTLHQVGNTWVDSLGGLLSALASSELAIFESIDPAEQLMANMNLREADHSYREVFRPREVAWLEGYSSDWTVPLHKLSPIELYWKLNQELTKELCGSVREGDRFDHMDQYLYHLADSLGIETLGLETDSAQSRLINEGIGSNTWKAMRPMIRKDIRSMRKGKANAGRCELVHRYMRLDIGNYALDAPCPVDDPVIAERNAQWMEVLPQLLMERSCFIAVGLMHLFKDCGLINRLQEAGFVVAPIGI